MYNSIEMQKTERPCMNNLETNCIKVYPLHMQNSVYNYKLIEEVKTQSIQKA